MPDSLPVPAPMRAAAIIVAAGEGLRAGQPVPKQFARWRGKPVVRHSAEALAAAGMAPIIVAIPSDADEVALTALAGISGIKLVTGGPTRQTSVGVALEALAEYAPDHVLIHDAARPLLSHAVIDRLLAAMADHKGAIPVLPVVDSQVTAGENEAMGAPADRAALRRVQTPQAFHFPAILAAHRNWVGEAIAGDDAQVARADNIAVVMVEGDEALHKLTFASDFARSTPVMRIGSGYDVHRLVAGEELWLCGVQLDHPFGLSGHSDADVAIHALVDAILGAIGEGDIGSHFPPSDPQWRGAASSQFLAHATKLAKSQGFQVGNADVTIICETPKIGPHRQQMRERIAELLEIEVAAVNVKATTTERLGFTGRGEGIAAQAAVMMMRDA